MRSRRNSASNKAQLVSVDQAFRRFRRDRTGGRLIYPSSLRRLAAKAVRDGEAAGAVARSAGVSEQSICNWLKEHQAGGAQELMVVPETPGPSSERAGVSELARIYLCSGVVIEVPMAALTSSFMHVLGGGVL